MSDKKGNVYRPDDLESLVWDWGTQQFVKGENFSLGVTIITPGQEHAKHNHPGIEEMFYVVSGKLAVNFYYDDGTKESFEAPADSWVHIPAGTKHDGKCISVEPAKFLVIYSPTGPETEQLRNVPESTILDPGEKPEYTATD